MACYKVTFCAVIAHKKHVKLQVFRGAEIAGSELLIGTGKVMRHLKFITLVDESPDLVATIVEQAIVLDRE